MSAGENVSSIAGSICVCARKDVSSIASTMCVSALESCWPHTPHPPHPIPPSQTTKDAFRIAVFYQPDTFYQGHPWACLLVLNNPHTAHNYRIYSHRRKFRGQTSDNMDRWKAEMGRVREEKRREEERRSKKRKSQKKEDPGAQEKSLNTAFFQWFVAPDGRKVGSLKRRVRSQLARWEMKNCTPLWRETHLQVKKLKTPHLRSTFGSWDVEKVHAVVARSTFPSQNVQSTLASEHKECTPLWHEAHFEVKMHKTPQLRSTFRSWDVEKVHTVVARSTCRSQNVQNTSCLDHFWKLRCRKSAHRCGAKHISKSKVQKKLRVRTTFGCSDVVSRGRRGTFEEDLQRCTVRGRRSTRDMFIRAVRRSGRWFPDRGCILLHLQFWEDDFAWQVQHFVWPGITFLWQAQYFISQNALVRGRQLCTQLSIFEGSLAELFRFWCCQLRKLRKSRSMVSFLMLSSSKIEEFLQNCFVFDVVKFKNWGSLAELLHFWCCQGQKLRKSRRIASFSSLQVDRQTDRQADKQIDI